MSLLKKRKDNINTNTRSSDAATANMDGMPLRLPLPEAEAALTGTAALAFLGDAVYSLLARERLSLSPGSADRLHKSAAGMVNASAQAEGAKKILPHLNEKELSVYTRGRNMHTARRPKNSSDAEYHMATGLEALFGYLYLYGSFERIYTLFEIALS